jgi:hypothetical protein
LHAVFFRVSANDSYQVDLVVNVGIQTDTEEFPENANAISRFSFFLPKVACCRDFVWGLMSGKFAQSGLDYGSVSRFLLSKAFQLKMRENDFQLYHNESHLVSQYSDNINKPEIDNLFSLSSDNSENPVTLLDMIFEIPSKLSLILISFIEFT